MSHEDDLYVAIDLGAGSGRVMLGGFAAGEVLLEEVRRFRYPFSEREGHLRWPFGGILRDIRAGLAAAGARARALGRPVRSVGVDTWGVDYGFVDAAGALIEDPICYRDARTEGMIEEACRRMPRQEIFERTGIQFIVINSLFQLVAHAAAGLPARAARFLMIPDLVNHALCGRAVNEYSNASTTQLVNARTRTWDPAILAMARLPAGLFGDIVEPGADLGPLLPAIAAEADLPGARLIAPATHDTGSAVAGAPLQDGWAYISSGTWSLVGVEIPGVLIDAEVARENFTNEGGAFGTIRFLKNVMGLWLLESCRKEWREAGKDVDYGALLDGVGALGDNVAGIVFPDEPRLFAPRSMVAALNQQLAETGQEISEDPVVLTKVILDSLALRYAQVVDVAERLTRREIPGTQIVGGGCQNAYLNQMTAIATRRPVLAGPVEATATGNLLVQAIASGRFTGLAEARAHVRANVTAKRFEPRDARGMDAARRRYAEIAARYAGATA